MTVPAEVVTVEINEEAPAAFRPMSWRAVLAGVVVALVVHAILSILGAAIGLGFVNPLRSDNPSPTTVTVIGMIWWTLSGILAAYAGGVTAGRLCGRPATATAAWHGLVTWATSVLIVFWLLTSAVGSLIGGAFSVLGTAAEAVAGGAVAVAPAVAEAADPFAGIAPGINDALGVQDPAAAREAVIGLVRGAFTADEASAQAAIDRAADAFARAARIPPEEAKARITEWKQQYDQAVAAAEQKALEAANAARKAASSAGILSVIALVFGALAGWYGGWNSPLPESEVRFSRFARREIR